MSAILIGYNITTIMSTISITDPPVYSCQYNYIKQIKFPIYLLPSYYFNYKIKNKYIK